MGRLFARVNAMLSKKRYITHKAKLHGKKNEKSRLIKTTSKHNQKRDKYGRFVKINRLGIAKHNPPRLRDKNGRFIAKTVPLTKPPLPWYRSRYATLVPIIVGICGAIFFGYQLNKPITVEAPVATSQVQAAETTEPKIADVKVAMSRSEPIRLRISKIAVDAAFTSLGKKVDDTIEVPGKPDIVGWYTKAPTPGELGPAIVIGHVDRPGGPAVFWRLRELVPGDTFEIDRADGSTAAFRVDEVKQVSQSSFPTEEVYGNIDYAGIRLITCGGTWNRTIRKYSHNTIVYGSLIAQDSNNKTASAL